MKLCSLCRLVALLGSLLVNTSIENIVCVHRVYEKDGFWTTHVSCCIPCALPSWQAKIADPWVRPNRQESNGEPLLKACLLDPAPSTPVQN